MVVELRPILFYSTLYSTLRAKLNATEPEEAMVQSFFFTMVFT